MHRPSTRLLSALLLLVAASTLALTACNSGSVSGSQTKPATSASMEAKSPARPAGGARSQGLIDAAIANIR